MNLRFGLALLVYLMTTVAVPASAETPPAKADTGTEQGPEPVVEPRLDRRRVTVPRIAASDVEAGIFTGTLSIENFGSQTVNGGRIAYHLTDRVFVEAVSAKSTVSDQFYRDRAFPVFNNASVPLTYYNFSAGFNLLPGESFLTKDWAMSSAFYLIAGLGTTTIDREKFSTFNFGFGYRVLLSDWFALHLDVRDHVFNSDLLGKNQRTDNFEMTAGFTFFF